MNRIKRSQIFSIIVALSFSTWSGVLSPCQPASAQLNNDPDLYYRAPSTIHGKTVVIPTGAHFEGTINETIGSTTPRGQRFSIEITSPVMANATDVIIPSGSKIIGEVVEAIPSSRQKTEKGKMKRSGKLRTQLKMLVTPDGMSYPIFASIQAENIATGMGRLQPNRDYGDPSIGYVGSQASFEAVQPGMDMKRYSGRGPHVVDKREFFRDPILGNDQRGSKLSYGAPVIRSIQKKGNEIYIYAGSPLTVKLDGPLKIGIAPSKGAMSIDLDPVTPSLNGGNDGSFRRFQPASQAPPQQQNQPAQPQQPVPIEAAPPEPDSDIPAFLRKPRPSGGFLPPQGAQGNQGAPPINQGGPPPVLFQAPLGQPGGTFQAPPGQPGGAFQPGASQPPPGSIQAPPASAQPAPVSPPPQQLPQGLQARPGESF